MVNESSDSHPSGTKAQAARARHPSNRGSISALLTDLHWLEQAARLVGLERKVRIWQAAAATLATTTVIGVFW